MIALQDLHLHQFPKARIKLWKMVQQGTTFLKAPTFHREIPGRRGNSNARRCHAYLGYPILVTTKVSNVVIIDQVP